MAMPPAIAVWTMPRTPWYAWPTPVLGARLHRVGRDPLREPRHIPGGAGRQDDSQGERQRMIERGHDRFRPSGTKTPVHR
jgi:hypothetical protein